MQIWNGNPKTTFWSGFAFSFSFTENILSLFTSWFIFIKIPHFIPCWIRYSYFLSYLEEMILLHFHFHSNLKFDSFWWHFNKYEQTDSDFHLWLHWNIIDTNWLAATTAQWNSDWDSSVIARMRWIKSRLGPFWVELSCSPCPYVAFLRALQLPPTFQKDASWVNLWFLVVPRCEFECL